MLACVRAGPGGRAASARMHDLADSLADGRDCLCARACAGRFACLRASVNECVARASVATGRI